MTTQADSILNLCPIQIGTGDRDFNGHGPDVYVIAELVIKTDRTPNAVFLHVVFSAIETVADSTQAANEWEQQVATLPAGFQFDGWIDSARSTASYVDNNHAVDYPTPNGTFVSRFAIVGDTSGNDVGACTADDCRIVAINYNAARFYIKKPCP